MIPYEKTNPLDELENLLEKQIRLSHRGSANNLEQLTNQADRLVKEIAQTGILQLSETNNRREHIKALYADLCLTLTAQKADLAERIHQIHRVIKTVESYRNYM